MSGKIQWNYANNSYMRKIDAAGPAKFTTITDELPIMLGVDDLETNL